MRDNDKKDLLEFDYCGHTHTFSKRAIIAYPHFIQIDLQSKAKVANLDHRHFRNGSIIKVCRCMSLS
jgi:hypothetical protein